MNRPKILLATNNKHKKIELEQILPGFLLQTPDEIGISFDCDETGTSFLENSLLKAETLFKIAGTPVIADDSGLCVEGLDGQPGIFSSRYGMGKDGKELESSERNKYLLYKMYGLKSPKERSAVFVCCMSVIFNKYRFYTVQETMNGYISNSPAGCGGFGYDPIFFLPQFKKTVAELSDEQKNKISHRGKAALRIAKLLEESQQ